MITWIILFRADAIKDVKRVFIKNKKNNIFLNKAAKSKIILKKKRSPPVKLYMFFYFIRVK